MVLVKPPSSCFLGTSFSESNKPSLKIRESEDFSNHFPLVKTWDFRFGEFTLNPPIFQVKNGIPLIGELGGDFLELQVFPQNHGVRVCE